MIEDDEDDKPVDRRKLSQVPSWLMVGFLVGVVTMWAFRSEPPEPEPQPAPPPPTAQEVVAEKPSVTAPEDQASFVILEALFDEYRSWAFWNEDRTQIALWNSKTLGFTDHFEVIRTLEGDYFRSIRAFTRLPIPGYGPPNSPILFTWTAEQKAKHELQLNPGLLKLPERPEPIELKSLPPPPGRG